MSEQKCHHCNGGGLVQECCGVFDPGDCCNEPIVGQCLGCNATGIMEVEDVS